jgi:hypothetical protein
LKDMITTVLGFPSVWAGRISKVSMYCSFQRLLCLFILDIWSIVPSLRSRSHDLHHHFIYPYILILYCESWIWKL